MVAGVGHAESGLYFGYNGLSFGILYVNAGVREIRTLTITTKSSNAENITVTLNGVAFTVAVTNGANTIKTAYEMSLGVYSGWTAEPRGSTVVFLSNSAGAKSGSYSVTGTSVIGSFAQTTAGVASTDTWIAQTQWNGDKLDGTGNSGLILDPAKGNNFSIYVENLGFGDIKFNLNSTGINNLITVHTIKTTNNSTSTALSNAAFPFTAAAYSAGSTTNLSVFVGGYSVSLCGQKRVSSNRFTFNGSSTVVNATDYTCLFTIRNGTTYNNRANQVVIDILSITAAMKHTQPGSIFLLKNATLSGTPNFATYSTSSCIYYDTAATICTISDNSQLLASLQLGESGQVLFPFLYPISLQTDDTITLAARSITGAPAYVLGSINIIEDH